jgi:Cu2+-exporting ATPase
MHDTSHHKHSPADHSCSDTDSSHQEKHSHDNHQGHHAHMVEDFRKKFWISLILSIPVLVLSPMVQMFFGIEGIGFSGDVYVRFILASIIFFYGGYPFLKGLYDEVKARQPGMMTLVALAISAAYGYSIAVFAGLPGEELLWELVTLVDIMLLGHWIEMRSVMGASRALEELAKLMPSTAHRLGKDGETEDVQVADLSLGDRVLVKPGEKIPVDGIVVEGRTSVNEAMLTGETKLIEKFAGQSVIGGSVNSDGSIVVEIQKVGKDTYLSQIIELVSSAQAEKSKTQKLADRAAMWLTFVAIGAGILTFFGWTFFTSENLAYALQRTIAVIVIACPHALGLAIPLVVSVSTALSARKGLLIRNRTAFEEARNITAVVFDKTGTLTKGKFGITEVVPLGNEQEDRILAYAAAIEAHSEHPIAKAIAERVSKKLAVNNFSSIPGKGAMGTVEGKQIKVVSPGYLNGKSITVNNKNVERLIDEGRTVVFVLVNELPIGAIALDDLVRDEAKEVVQKLQAMGIEPIMLTGDAKRVAERVSKELGIKTYYAEVLPHEKTEKIKEIQAQGYKVAMVGDGVNDAPALAQANVGIAIGAGTDVAIESADVVLVKSDPRDVVVILSLAKATYRKMIQNLWWASGYNILALPLAAGVLAGVGIVLSPAVGAVLMSVSTVVVAINATLLKNYRM